MPIWNNAYNCRSCSIMCQNVFNHSCTDIPNFPVCFVHHKNPAINISMLLLLLSHFSRVRLCATPWTAAHQAPPSLGFSRQEHWSGLPFPSPMQESESEVAQSSPTLSNPMDCSLPGSSIHGIFQARVLEWGAIAFSKRSSIQSAKTRPGADCGSDHELLIAKFRLKLKK